MFGERALSIVDEDRVRPRRREDDEIEVAIAVGVRERRTRREAIAGTNAGDARDVLELPVASISVERIAAFRPRENTSTSPSPSTSPSATPAPCASMRFPSSSESLTEFRKEIPVRDGSRLVNPSLPLGTSSSRQR